MAAYYQAKVELVIQLDNGNRKKRTDIYIVKAESSTDVEAKIYKEMEGFPEDWEVTSITKTKIVGIL